jgi:4-amino-4-deoxy-L-arabinose transferase-like glycosyltransferase
VTALLARELGGGPKAQAWTAWAMTTTSAITIFGHVLLTSTADLVAWPLVCLCVLRAELRAQPRWWLAAGAVAGLATYNKLLVAVLLLGVAVGLALVGPRRRLASPWVLGGGGLALLLALPNVVYQVAHGWPELDMGRALSDNNAGDVRSFMWVFLLVVLGPPLVVIWAGGLRQVWRDRRIRFFVVAFMLLVAFTFASGAQPHYPMFLLPLFLAAGMVAMERHLGRVWAALLVVNAAVSVVVGLPVLPQHALGRSPVPGMNLIAADSVGWPAYVDQVTSVYDALPDRAGAAVFTSNYGEAGSIHHYRPDVPVYSAQNALYDQARPPAGVGTLVVVGGQYPDVRALFDSCRVVAHLDNGVGVDNEEQGEPMAVCHGPTAPWTVLWPRLRHLD